MSEAFESGNRRAEIDGNVVTFFRISGKVRRTKQGVWKTAAQNAGQAKRLANRWIKRGLLGKPVLKGT